MKQMIKFIGAALLVTFCLTGCGGGNGITQEEYDAVVAERDELQEKHKNVMQDRDNWKKRYEKLSEEAESSSASLDMAKEKFSVFEDMTFSELEGGKQKVLVISIYVKSMEDLTDNYNEFALKTLMEEGEDWCDYDYFFIEIWNDTMGPLISMVTDTSDHSTKTHQWLEAE